MDSHPRYPTAHPSLRAWLMFLHPERFRGHLGPSPLQPRLILHPRRSSRSPRSALNSQWRAQASRRCCYVCHHAYVVGGRPSNAGVRQPLLRRPEKGHTGLFPHHRRLAGSHGHLGSPLRKFLPQRLPCLGWPCPFCPNMDILAAEVRPPPQCNGEGTSRLVSAWQLLWIRQPGHGRPRHLQRIAHPSPYCSTTRHASLL